MNDDAITEYILYITSIIKAVFTSGIPIFNQLLYHTGIANFIHPQPFTMMLCTAKNRKRVNQRRRIVPTQPMKKHRTIITKNLRNQATEISQSSQGDEKKPNTRDGRSRQPEPAARFPNPSSNSYHNPSTDHRSIPRHSRTIANPYFENSNSEYLFRRNSVCMEIFTQSNFSSLPGVEAAHFTEQKCNQKPSQDYGNIPWPLLKFVHCEKKLLDYFPHVGQSFGKSLPPENFKMTGFCFSCFALTKSTNCSWRGHPKSDTSFCWKCLVDKKSLCGIGNAILCKKAPIMAIAMWSVRNGPGYDDMKKKYNEVNGENMYFKGISTPLNVETHDIKDCIYWIKDNQVTYWNAVDDVLKKKKNKNRVSINHAESSSFITDSPTTSSNNSISFYQHGQTTNSSGPNMMEIPTIITQEDAHDEETNGFTEASSYIQNNERKQYRNVPTASSTSWPKVSNIIVTSSNEFLCFSFFIHWMTCILQLAQQSDQTSKYSLHRSSCRSKAEKAAAFLSCEESVQEQQAQEVNAEKMARFEGGIILLFACARCNPTKSC